MGRNIVLVGPMGAGKTTIGKLVAQELDLPFKDIDHIIVERTGADIPWIFDVEGESGFRRRESQVLAEVLEADTAVIATGGGIVTRPDNRDCLKQADALVVFLNATVAQQFQRTSKDKNRPLLQKANPQQVLEQLMQEREPWYREVSGLVLETGNNRARQLVKTIAAAWREAQ